MRVSACKAFARLYLIVLGKGIMMAKVLTALQRFCELKPQRAAVVDVLLHLAGTE